jgi:hypothetical protein
MSGGQGNGARGEMGERVGGAGGLEEIEQLIVSTGLVSREARNQAQRATIPNKGLIHLMSLFITCCVYYVI